MTRRKERWHVGHGVVLLNLWTILWWGKGLVTYVPHSFLPFRGIAFHIQPELCITARHCAAARLLSIK